MAGLVIKRGVGQRVLIGTRDCPDLITVEVAQVRRDDGGVKLRVLAPDDIIVDREEVAERRRAERSGAC